MSGETHGVASQGGVVEDERKRDMVHVIVFAPRFVEPKTFDWALSLRVGEAAKQAALAFGYAAGGQPGLQTDHEPPRTLDNNKTLREEQVHNKEKLELIDTGGGV